MKKTFMGILFTQMVFISSAICMENSEIKDDVDSDVTSAVLLLSLSSTNDNNNTVSDVTETVSKEKKSNNSNLKKLFYCKTCGRKFKSSQEKDQHRKFAHDEERVQCPSCLKSYTSIGRLNSHKCGFKKDSKNPHQYKRFMKISTKPKERDYRCIHCNQPYAKKIALEQHEVECDGTLHKRMVTKDNITQDNKRKAEYVDQSIKKIKIGSNKHYDFNKNKIYKNVAILPKPVEKKID